MKYKYRGIKININDKYDISKLIIHLREEGRPHYKTYYYKSIDREYTDREEMLRELKKYLGWKIKELKL